MSAGRPMWSSGGSVDVAEACQTSCSCHGSVIIACPIQQPGLLPGTRIVPSSGSPSFVVPSSPGNPAYIFNEPRAGYRIPKREPTE